MKLTLKGRAILLIILLTGFAAAQTTTKDRDLPNFAEVHANFYRGGQPTEAGVKKLAAMGVKTIIDLRGEDGLAEQEKIWAKSAGVKFVAVNLSNWFKPKNSEIESIIGQIDAADNQPVFVHCRRGADRTGTIAAVYRIKHNHYTAKQAIAEAKTFKFGWWQFWMKDYIEDYYDKNASLK